MIPSTTNRPQDMHPAQWLSISELTLPLPTPRQSQDMLCFEQLFTHTPSFDHGGN